MSVSTTDNKQEEALSFIEVLTRTPRLSPEQWAALNPAAKWLVMVRAVVLVMTANAALIGIVVAAAEVSLAWDRVVGLILGLTLAHATNNLVNDWTDTRTGVDDGNYFRRQYGTHVIQDGLVTARAFFAITLLTGLTALLCGVYLVMQLGTSVLLLTLAGAFFVLFYTWPLKHYALGEIAVLLVWGPLITAGSTWVLTETLTLKTLLISLIAGIGPTLVIFGKHMDKYSHDKPRGVRTLPVVLGPDNSRYLMFALLAAKWLLILLAILVYDMPALWLCLLAAYPLLPLAQSLRSARPETEPDDYPVGIWPLWYAAYAFRYCRDFSFYFLLALIVSIWL
jgi:1,4-dihydroxy-2-naphthoate octaprenyltransferase